MSKKICKKSVKIPRSVLKAFNIGFSNFEQFKTMLAISETVFGTYVGIVLSSVFTIDTDKTAK